MKRPSGYIPTNIAEGGGRSPDTYLCRFLYFSYNSAKELEYQILLSMALNFIDSIKGPKFLFN
jgi:four helix bundle protein